MSVVIALKDEKNKRFALGADGQVTRGQLKMTLPSSCGKIWQVTDGIIMGGVGSLRDIQIVRASALILPTEFITEVEINEIWIINCLVPRIFTALREQKRLYRDKDSEIEYMESVFIFAVDDNAFIIDNFGGVIPVDDYCAIGSGEEVAIGVLEATRNNKEMSIQDRILAAINACADKTIYVNDAADILYTAEDIETIADEKLLTLLLDKWKFLLDDDKDMIYDILENTTATKDK